MLATKNSPRAFAPDHFGRCTASALVAGRSVDLRLAVHDFEACGANECAELVREFDDALLSPSHGISVRLFRFKMRRAWERFEVQLSNHRKGNV